MGGIAKYVLFLLDGYQKVKKVTENKYEISKKIMPMQIKKNSNKIALVWFFSWVVLWWFSKFLRKSWVGMSNYLLFLTGVVRWSEKGQKHPYVILRWSLIPILLSGGVHKLRLQDEVGRWLSKCQQMLTKVGRWSVICKR